MPARKAAANAPRAKAQSSVALGGAGLVAPIRGSINWTSGDSGEFRFPFRTRSGNINLSMIVTLRGNLPNDKKLQVDLVKVGDHLVFTDVLEATAGRPYVYGRGAQADDGNYLVRLKVSPVGGGDMASAGKDTFTVSATVDVTD